MADSKTSIFSAAAPVASATTDTKVAPVASGGAPVVASATTDTKVAPVASGGAPVVASAAAAVAGFNATPPSLVEKLDVGDVTRQITLTSKDGKAFKIAVSDALISDLVKQTLEGDKKADSFPVPGVTGDTLALIVQYMQMHKGVEPPIIPKPLRSREMKDVVTFAGDAPFINDVWGTGVEVHKQRLYDLILGANYMNVKSLLYLACAKVASLIKGQPLEKIKDILNPKLMEALASIDAKQKATAAGSAGMVLAPTAGNTDQKK